MKIILHSDDINLLSYWESAIKEDFIVYDELDELENSVSNIIIINYSALIPDVKKVINSLVDNSNLVLVLHRTPNIQVAKELLSYGVKGYGNAYMKDHFINSAIATMKENMVWLFPEITSQLISEVPVRQSRDVAWIHDKLTDRETEVALLLEAGDTYKAIAHKLEITPRTVKAHAQQIYKKLHVKDRLALALLVK